jgi:hypothetical protein
MDEELKGSHKQCKTKGSDRQCKEMDEEIKRLPQTVQSNE